MVQYLTNVVSINCLSTKAIIFWDCYFLSRLLLLFIFQQSPWDNSWISIWPINGSTDSRELFLLKNRRIGVEVNSILFRKLNKFIEVYFPIWIQVNVRKHFPYILITQLNPNSFKSICKLVIWNIALVGSIEKPKGRIQFLKLLL